MAEKLWPRRIGRRGYIGGERLWWSCDGAQRAWHGALVRQSEREKARASEWSERRVRSAYVLALA